jgi:4-hydroxy-2-oxoheptanedioate aldolase
MLASAGDMPWTVNTPIVTTQQSLSNNSAVCSRMNTPTDLATKRQFQSMRPALEAGRPLFGWYATFQIPDIVEMVGSQWDWIWIDLQHSPTDLEAALSLVRAAEAAQSYALSRVGKNDSYLIGQALDLGSSGVIVPMVNTPEEALAAVRAAKFPPLGRRSFGSRRLAGLYGLDYADHANQDTVVFVQLESAQAIDDAEAIAAVEGIDGLIFSPDDFVREKGLNVVIPRPPDLGREEKARVVQAAQRHGKVAGCFCDRPDSLKASLQAGYRLLMIVEEDTVILDGSLNARKWVDSTLASDEYRQPTERDHENENDIGNH